MNSCEFVTFISTIACSIAKCVDKDELALIGAALAQLGDTITTMAVRDELCSRKTNVSAEQQPGHALQGTSLRLEGSHGSPVLLFLYQLFLSSVPL